MEQITQTDLDWTVIPTYNVDALKEKLAKLNKKADKLGVAHPVLILGNEWTTIHPSVSQEAMTEEERKRAPKITWINVLILGPRIKYADWEFHAQIEHTEHGNIINSKDATETELVDYRTCPPNCDHCHKVRRRKHTYIVKKTEEV